MDDETIGNVKAMLLSLRWNVPYFPVIGILFLNQHFPIAAVRRTNVF